MDRGRSRAGGPDDDLKTMLGHRSESAIPAVQVDPNELIASIASKLDSIGYGNDPDILGRMFREIFQAMAETRKNIAKHKDEDGDGVTLLEVNIDTSVQPPEIQLAATVDTRGKIARVIGWGERPRKEIMVFTTEGYRPATPETLESHRYMAGGHNQASRAVLYSQRAYGAIDRFLRPFNKKFLAAIKGKS